MIAKSFSDQQRDYDRHGGINSECQRYQNRTRNWRVKLRSTGMVVVLPALFPIKCFSGRLTSHSRCRRWMQPTHKRIQKSSSSAPPANLMFDAKECKKPRWERINNHIGEIHRRNLRPVSTVTQLMAPRALSRDCLRDRGLTVIGRERSICNLRTNRTDDANRLFFFSEIRGTTNWSFRFTVPKSTS